MSAALAFGLKLAGWVWKPFKAALGWVFADVRHAMIALLLFVTAHDRWKTIPALRDEVSETHAEAVACNQTVANLQEAARQAAIRQQANLVRVDAAHAAINRENVSGLHAEIEGLRRRAELLSASAADRVRGGSAAANSRSADAAGVPGPVSARTGTAEAARDQGLSGTGGGSCPVTPGAMTIERALIASEQAHQLDRLINAVEAAAGMDLSPDRAAGQ